MTPDVNIILNIRRINYVRRCNTYPSINDESVATHSYNVSVLCSIIGNELTKLGYQLDMGTLLQKALFHDVEEAYISDIPWNIKHDNPDIHKAISKTIQSKLEKIFENSIAMKKYNDFIICCKSGAEGIVVDFADMLELAIYCYEEVLLGNSQIKKLGAKALQLLNKDTDTKGTISKDIKSIPVVQNLLETLEDTLCPECPKDMYFNID